MNEDNLHKVVLVYEGLRSGDSGVTLLCLICNAALSRVVEMLEHSRAGLVGQGQGQRRQVEGLVGLVFQVESLRFTVWG